MRSAPFVIGWVIVKALCKWICACVKTCRREGPLDGESGQLDEESGGGGQEHGAGTDFIVVEFNAWECAGSDVLWAAVVTKIFDKVC